jgi:hypothetical protein
MHKFEKISTVKPLLFICTLFVLACSAPESTKLSAEYGDYKAANHQTIWDTKAFYIWSDFQNLQSTMSSQDTLAIYTAVQKLKATTDTLLVQNTATDSLTQNIWVGGLTNLSNELGALLQEKEITEINTQFQMCTLNLLNFLGSIGYQKTNIYIFQNQINGKELFWVSNVKTTKNPFNNKDRNTYTATSLLQAP